VSVATPVASGPSAPTPAAMPRRTPGIGERFASSLVGAATVVAVLFLGIPIVALIARAIFGGALEAGVSPRIVDALVLSLVTSGVSLMLAFTFGTPLALALALARRSFRGRVLVETLVDLPIVLPPAVAGLALLRVFGRRGLLGAPLETLGIANPFATVAVILAQTFVSAPFHIRAARAGFAGVDHEVDDAARVDCAGEWSVFRHVTVPLAGGALTAGLVMTWARALGEFGATITFAGAIQGRTETLPIAVYAEFQSSLDASIAAAAILVAVAFAVLAAVRFMHWRAAIDLGRLR